jgi:malate dehydrogenase (oxaloacetate-decarboxylating)(NADP+)
VRIRAPLNSWFPIYFRGALDVRATKINEAMKMAAVKALALLTKESVPEQVNIAWCYQIKFW